MHRSMNYSAENFSVSDVYHPWDKKRIWAVIADYRAQCETDDACSKNLISLFEENFKNFELKNRGTRPIITIKGTDIEAKVSSIVVRQINKYYDHPEKRRAAQTKTWKFLDVVSQLISRMQLMAVEPWVFEHFEFEPLPLANVPRNAFHSDFIASPIMKQDAAKSGILCFEETYHEYCVGVKLWIRNTPSQLVSETISLFESECQTEFTPWEGLAQFSGSSRNENGEMDPSDSFKLVAVLKNFQTGDLATVSFLKPLQADSQQNDGIVTSPHIDIAYQILPVKWGEDR
ncbi:MAG: hypothetical protein AAGA72_05215 [Pseudomonadota bacterium]